MTTAKMNKEQMVSFLDQHFNEVTDENLKSRITYTANAWKKDADSVKLSDLRPLVKEVEALLPKEEKKSAPVNSAKKTLKKSTPKKEPEKQEEAPTEEAEKPEEKTEEKKPAKKLAKKTTPKKPVAVEKSSDKGVAFDLASVFIDTIQTEIGTLEKAQDIKTFADLKKALEAEEEVYFAIYWSERLLRQFDYNGNLATVKKPKKFENDLDLVSCIYLSDEEKLAVGISSYTDMPYIIQPKDMEVTEDNMRYTNNMEFELYRLTNAVE